MSEEKKDKNEKGWNASRHASKEWNKSVIPHQSQDRDKKELDRTRNEASSTSSTFQSCNSWNNISFSK